MTGSDVAGEAQGFPAPGSSVPGAPPALKRALVPADGVPFTSPTAQDGWAENRRGERSDGGNQGHSPDPPRAANSSGSLLITAAAMLGIAVGLELAGLSGSSHRRRRNSPHVLT
jgi:hypothetical protein